MTLLIILVGSCSTILIRVLKSKVPKSTVFLSVTILTTYLVISLIKVSPTISLNSSGDSTSIFTFLCNSFSNLFSVSILGRSQTMEQVPCSMVSGKNSYCFFVNLLKCSERSIIFFLVSSRFNECSLISSSVNSNE